MQWLSLISEDAGVQNLKAENRRPAATRSVDPVSAYPKTHPVRLGERAEAGTEPVEDRRQGERRQQERRKKQVPVLLDTRSAHDRRGIENRRRAEASPERKPAPRTRLNLYA